MGKLNFILESWWKMSENSDRFSDDAKLFRRKVSKREIAVSLFSLVGTRDSHSRSLVEWCSDKNNAF